MSAVDPRDLRRGEVDELATVTTRWSDNDMFGHLNNAVYFELFDSALNAWMIREADIDESTAPVVGVVAESSCRFYAEVAYPGDLEVGVRVVRIGTRSVVFELGLFVPGRAEVAAHGRWAQVYIDRETRHPAQIPPAVRTMLEGAVAARSEKA